jgi:hypothetical protein
MDNLQQFFTNVISNTTNLQSIAKKYNLDVYVCLDIPSEDSKFFKLIEFERNTGTSMESIGFVSLNYSFIQNDDKITVKIDDKELLVNDNSDSSIKELAKEFRGIINNINEFFKKFDLYKVEIQNLTRDNLINIENQFNNFFRSIIYTWAYLVLKRLQHNDVITCFLLESPTLLPSEAFFPMGEKILDDVMLSLKYTEFDNNSVRTKNSWGLYWQNSIGSIPDINVFYFMIAEWYRARQKIYHAIAVFEYWFMYENVERSENEDISEPKIPYYYILGTLYQEIKDLEKAKQAYEIYKKFKDPDDVLEDWRVGYKLEEIEKAKKEDTIIHLTEQLNRANKLLKDPNVQSYIILKELEPQLKNALRSILEQQHVLPDALFDNKNVEEVKRYRIIKSRISKEYSKYLKKIPIDLHLIMENCDMDDLLFLLGYIGRHFSNVFNRNDFKEIMRKVNSIILIRNKTMHFHQIEDSEVDFLNLCKNKILEILNRYNKSG